MRIYNTRATKLSLLTFILVSLVFVYFSPIVAQGQTNTDTPSAADRATYKGVDQSITDFLCTPTDPTTGTTAGTTTNTVLGLGERTVVINQASNDLYDCINKLYRFGIAFGAVAGVFFIVLAGYYYISGSEAAISKAKTTVGGVIIGLLIMLTSFILLKQINPDLVRFRPIQPPEFTNPCPGDNPYGVGGSCELPSCENAKLGELCRLPNDTAAVSDGKGGGTSFGGRTCNPITNNASPASIDNLSKSCFGQYGADVVKAASIVASRESSGNPSLPVSAGSCGAGKRPARCTGGEIPVWGLYQINITTHKVGGLNCPAAFTGGWTCSKSCTVVDKDLYNKCVEAAKNATTNTNVACELYQKNKAAGRPGFNDWGNVANEHGKKCGF